MAVIGRRSRFVTRENAPDYVLGYTCGNDVTARGMQAQSSQWSLCKGFDTFGPVGPCIDTSVNPACLDIELRLNGVVRQRSNTRNLIFDVAYLVSYLSHVMTLEPGDALFTGTPSGVSPIRAGDVMEVDIQGIGVLKNTVR